ncbi:malonate decarboxylase holo-ACP synthase [Anaerobacillus sp. MEB173]|uniref:malonate decarboxylase holo-ACP synthase n=1 Tax=Anaerobacillus sp. MEB173 TaxID=3383345 RepID=UPI003F907842
MELNPHDLLEINDPAALFSYTAIPHWVDKSLTEAPFVVVRRADAPKGYVAVGVRGSMRNERFAAFLTVDRIVNCITPEMLSRQKGWQKINREIFHQLDRVDQLMNHFALSWGPAGSCGFELASQKETVTSTSDIDIIIRPGQRFSQELARKLVSEFSKLPIRIDAQVETSEGAFSLNEYANSAKQSILFRTNNGPMLKKLVQISVLM